MQVPVEWESVSVAPVRTPDGHITVPEEVIHSMKRNKIGLKGKVCVCVCVCLRRWLLFYRSTGDTSWKRSSFSQSHIKKVS